MINNKETLITAVLDVLMDGEFFPIIRLTDIGALVFLGKIIEWEFPDFSVDRYFKKLLTLNEKIIDQGYIESKGHGFVIICQKPI